MRLIAESIEQNVTLSAYLLNLLTQQIASKLPDLVTSNTIAKQSLFYPRLLTFFRWSELNETQQQLKTNVVRAHAALCEFFAKSKAKVLYEKNYKCISRTFNSFTESDLDEYVGILRNLNSSVAACILWDNVIRFSVESGKKCFEPHRQHILDLFVKNVVMTKVKVADIVAPFCFANTMHQISLEDFTNTLLPAIQKAVLRSAETSLVLIAFLLDPLPLDLSHAVQGIVL